MADHRFLDCGGDGSAYILGSGVGDLSIDVQDIVFLRPIYSRNRLAINVGIVGGNATKRKGSAIPLEIDQAQFRGKNQVRGEKDGMSVIPSRSIRQKNTKAGRCLNYIARCRWGR